MLQAAFRPLLAWPLTPTVCRKRAPFRAGYLNTLDLLEDELFRLSAKDVVIQISLNARDIRNDGYPRSDARPTSPGIIVSFTSRGSSMSFPCDRFDSWEDNLRAIALSLKALRAVNRYGVTRSNEQYRGWSQLPAADQQRPLFDAAIALLELVPDHRISEHTIATASSVVNVQGDFQTLYRRACVAHHPDANGGATNDVWHRLQRAAEVLKKHHGIA